MNPEEGELRPQLLDRFGLAVDLTTSLEPRDRAEAVRRRLDFDTDPAGVAEPRVRRSGARHPPRVHHRRGRARRLLMVRIGVLCAAAGVDGLRADLVISRAAATLAGRESRAEATVDDVRRVAPMALAHRQRRTPFDQPRENGIDDASTPSISRTTSTTTAERDRLGTRSPHRISRRNGSSPCASCARNGSNRAPITGRWQPRPPDRRPGAGRAGRRGRRRRHRPRVAERRAQDPEGPAVCTEDLREARREQRTGNLLVLAVDASGSMGAPNGWRR